MTVNQPSPHELDTHDRLILVYLIVVAVSYALKGLGPPRIADVRYRPADAGGDAGGDALVGGVAIRFRCGEECTPVLPT